jgi:predicted phosphodiesterase
MRRIAIFSDIHANLTALDAVLADVDEAGVTERYCLGDLIGYGPDPGGVIARIRDTGIPTIPGNYDEGVASRRGSCGCYYATDTARADGDESYRFTDAMLTEADADWLLALPGQIRLDHAGASILFTHGSPRKINEYLLLDRTEAQLARLARQADADVVCHGHVHLAYHRSFVASADAAATASPRTATREPVGWS